MNPHHAIVFIANNLKESFVPEIYKTQTCDVSHIILDRFGINDARQLVSESLQKPIEGKYRVFVLVIKKLPEEAQNSLLKLFEEPPLNTRFYMVIPQEGMLIPTLLSRVFMERNSCLSEAPRNETFVSFLGASYSDRMLIIADITKNKKLEEIESIIQGAEVYVSENSIANCNLLETVIFVRKYIKTPGASAKMLLEELSLVLPTV